MQILFYNSDGVKNPDCIICKEKCYPGKNCIKKEKTESIRTS